MPNKKLMLRIALLAWLGVMLVIGATQLAQYQRGVTEVRVMLEDQTPWLEAEKDIGTFARDLDAGRVGVVGEALNLYLVTLNDEGRYFVFKSDAPMAALGEWARANGKLYVLQQNINPRLMWYSRIAQGALKAFAPEMIFMLLMLGLIAYQLRAMVGPTKRFGLVTKPAERFDDVIGVREAKRELSDMVLALRDNEAYTRLNAKPPRGVLLTGAPGTGKTLLAKAVAGESGANFIAVDGSAFTDKFLGNGVAKVRSLFRAARKNAPCVIFIDEIDGVGRRSRDDDAAAMENNRIINALLAELDGFSPTDRLIVLGATNHPENVDAALVREGRFDRNCALSLPPLEDRRELFALYAEEVPTAGDVDFALLARRTVGLSPAAIASTVMAAARLAARDRADVVTHQHFVAAVGQQLLGAPSPEVHMTDDERGRCAYHEAGHAIIGHDLGVGRVEKVTIMPHSQALGVTVLNPEEDRHLHSEQELTARIEMLLGGRAAEIVVFGSASSGAVNDLERATQLAYRMVAECGFGVDQGPLNLNGLPRHIQTTATSAVAETSALLKRIQQQAEARLAARRELLEQMAVALLAQETLEGDELAALLPPAVLQRRVPEGESRLAACATH